MRTSLCLLFAIAALPLAAQVERREDLSRRFPPDFVSKDVLVRDIVRLGSSHVRVDFENDRTRVLRLTLGPGEAIPLHDDRAGVLVCIGGCHIRFTTPGSQTQDVELKAGGTRWMPEARHSTGNLADGPVELLYIESKDPGM
jgi:quercetin dioxygenase-like cupin family protein